MDIAIIGGGAAGFMTAITARRINPSCKVTIFERAQKVLAKVEICSYQRHEAGLSTWA